MGIFATNHLVLASKHIPRVFCLKIKYFDLLLPGIIFFWISAAYQHECDHAGLFPLIKYYQPNLYRISILYIHIFLCFNIIISGYRDFLFAHTSKMDFPRIKFNESWIHNEFRIIFMDQNSHSLPLTSASFQQQFSKDFHRRKISIVLEDPPNCWISLERVGSQSCFNGLKLPLDLLEMNSLRSYTSVGSVLQFFWVDFGPAMTFQSWKITLFLKIIITFENILYFSFYSSFPNWELSVNI